MSDGIHTCSYHCPRPPCVLAQRNELRDRLEAAKRERDALAALLREIRPLVGTYELGGELIDRIDTALAAKEQCNG